MLRTRQGTNGSNYELSYAYNLAGGMTSETYPSIRVASTAYDNAGRPQLTGSQPGTMFAVSMPRATRYACV